MYKIRGFETIGLRHLLVCTFSVAIILCLSACETTPENASYEKAVRLSLEQLNTEIASMEVIPVGDLLESASVLQPRSFDVEINAKSARAVQLDGAKYLAKAYRITDSENQTVAIKSYIIPVIKKADYLYFPEITTYDTSQKVLAVIPPEQNYAISSGVLDLEFLIPQNAAYILIHTNQEYLNAGYIDGTESGLSPADNYSNNDISAFLGGFFGGAVGAVVVAIAKNSHYSSAPPENYFFGPGGILDIRVSSKTKKDND